MSHVVLLGDSVFDNKAHIRDGEPHLATQLQEKLPTGWRATLCAMDGAVTRHVEGQLRTAPSDASHLIISVGGTDAFGNSGILRENARSVAEVMGMMADVRDSFARSYGMMLDAVMRLRLPLAVCTIYDARFPDPKEQRLVITALSIFNDVILRQAFVRRIPLIDLRLICTEPDDYASPIETSAKGGEKIATAIAQAVTGIAAHPRSLVFAS